MNLDRLIIRLSYLNLLLDLNFTPQLIIYYWRKSSKILMFEWWPVKKPWLVFERYCFSYINGKIQLSLSIINKKFWFALVKYLFYFKFKTWTDAHPLRVFSYLKGRFCRLMWHKYFFSLFYFNQCTSVIHSRTSSIFIIYLITFPYVIITCLLMIFSFMCTVYLIN